MIYLWADVQMRGDHLHLDSSKVMIGSLVVDSCIKLKLFSLLLINAIGLRLRVITDEYTYNFPLGLGPPECVLLQLQVQFCAVHSANYFP